LALVASGRPGEMPSLSQYDQMIRMAELLAAQADRDGDHQRAAMSHLARAKMLGEREQIRQQQRRPGDTG
jgi:hypothetical protein